MIYVYIYKSNLLVLLIKNNIYKNISFIYLFLTQKIFYKKYNTIMVYIRINSNIEASVPKKLLREK